MVPLGKERYVLRTYGFSDRFRETPDSGGLWMEKPLQEWLDHRRVTPEEAGISFAASIFEAPLFPVLAGEEIREMLEFMVDSGSGPDGKRMEQIRDQWVRCDRLPAKELIAKADLSTLYQQRQTLKIRSLPVLAENQQTSIFYYLDLEKTAADYREAKLEPPAALPPGEPVIKRINDSMFRARVLAGRREAGPGRGMDRYTALLYHGRGQGGEYGGGAERTDAPAGFCPSHYRPQDRAALH